MVFRACLFGKKKRKFAANAGCFANQIAALWIFQW